MKKIVFKGVATALVTPFKKDFAVDYKAFERLVDYQVKSRVSALVVAGTTGEGATLDLKEKLRLLRICLERSRGVPVIAAVGSNDTLSSVRQAKTFEKAGANALLVITPYYNKTTDNGLIRHFYSIADGVDIPIVVYSVPSRTGLNVPVETYKKLSAHKNIVGLKEADEDMCKFLRTFIAVGDRMSVYSGDDKTFLPSLAAGGSGLISVLSNLCPQSLIAIYNAFMRGDKNRALEIKKRVYGLIRALFCQVNPIPIKYALSLTGRISNVLRLPLVPLDKKYEKAVAKEMKVSGII